MPRNEEKSFVHIVDYHIENRSGNGIGPETHGPGKRNFLSSGSIGDVQGGSISGCQWGSRNREKLQGYLGDGIGPFPGGQRHRSGESRLFESFVHLPYVAFRLAPEAAGAAVAASSAAVKLAVECAIVAGFSFDGGKSLGKGGSHDHPVFDPLFFIA